MAKDIIPASAAKSVSSHITIDKNDVLAITISKAELHMQKELVAATKEIKRLEKSIKDSDTVLKEHVAELAVKLAKPGVAKLEAAKEACGSKAKINTDWDMQQDKGTFRVSITIKTSDCYGSTTFGTLKGDFDATATELVEQLAADSQRLIDARETAVNWRRKLAQIPTLERQYRARLAEAALSKTQEGQELLEALSTNFEQDVLALPGI